MFYPILFTEHNIDGCGGTATELILLPNKPTGASLETLRNVLNRAKDAQKHLDWDTSDMVEHAAEIVFGKDNFVHVAPDCIDF